MADTYRAVIPYESLDPLTIGASGDDEKVNRETLELDIPAANLLAAIYPDEPDPVADATEAAQQALESPVSGPRFSELLSGGRQRRRRSSTTSSAPRRRRSSCPPCSTRSRRPVSRMPASSARTARSSRCRSPTSSRSSAARTSARMERLGIPFFQNEPRNADAYTYVGVSSRGTPGLAPQRGREARGHDLDRPGAVEPLGRGRRRQADPARRRLRRDDRVEPLRIRSVAADALRRLRGPDAVRHRRGRDDVRPRLHDERHPRHARTGDRVPLRLPSRGAPRGHPALQRDLRVRPSRRRRHRDLRGLRADRPPLLPHGLGLHVGRPRRSRGRLDHLLQPVARRLDGGRRLPGPRAHGPHEAVHAADAGELPARPEGHPRARDPDVGGLHLGADLRGHDAQAPHDGHPRGQPRDGRRHRHRGDDLAGVGLRRGDGAARPRREGHRAARSRATSCRATRSACTPRRSGPWRRSGSEAGYPAGRRPARPTEAA